jgi:hypothetical protein
MAVPAGYTYTPQGAATPQYVTHDPFAPGYTDPYGGLPQQGYAYYATPFWPDNSRTPQPDSPLYAAWLSYQSPAIQANAPRPVGQQLSREGAYAAAGRDEMGRHVPTPANGEYGMYDWSLNPATNGTAPAGTPTATGGIPEGGWQAWFQGLTGGRAPSPGELEALLPELQKYGVTLGNKNAMGIADSIILPGGQVVDVGSSFSSGDPARMGWSWQVEDGSSGGGPGGGDLVAPWTEKFAYDPFTAPTTVNESNSPGFDARLKAGQTALERSASAKGTLLTSGTLKDLETFAQDYGKNEYQNLYNNKFNEWKTGYDKAAGEYTQRYNEFQNQQGNAYTRMLGVAQLGLGAQNSMAQYGQGYANNMGNIYGDYGRSLNDLITGAGNANAAAGIAGTNAWLNAGNNIVNTGVGLYGSYQGMQQPTNNYGRPNWSMNGQPAGVFG